MSRLGDTWEWDGQRWERRDIEGPPARSAADMVYDSANGRMLLFGGQYGRGEMLGDTWEYDGTRWRQIETPESPSPRMFHTMAYDKRRRVTVLFGGANYKERKFGMDDTWVFDGRRWRQQPKKDAAHNPIGRDHHAMTYDGARHKVVLFGGGLGIDRRHINMGDTWEWDGEWKIRADLAAPPRSGKPGMVFDSHTNQILIYGGWNDAGMTGDLWRIDGRTWRPAASASTVR